MCKKPYTLCIGVKGGPVVSHFTTLEAAMEEAIYQALDGWSDNVVWASDSEGEQTVVAVVQVGGNVINIKAMSFTPAVSQSADEAEAMLDLDELDRAIGRKSR